MVWLRSEAIWRAWESSYLRREDWCTRVVIWGFLGHDGQCGCTLQGGVGVLEVGELFAEGGECSSERVEVGI
jgi:hypothetical protein